LSGSETEQFPILPGISEGSPTPAPIAPSRLPPDLALAEHLLAIEAKKQTGKYDQRVITKAMITRTYVLFSTGDKRC
jgi:hypothetical protein